MWSEHRFEVVKTFLHFGLAIVLGVSAYIWNETIADIRQDVAENRRLVASLAERIRVIEIAAEGNRAFILGITERLTRVENSNTQQWQRLNGRH